MKFLFLVIALTLVGCGPREDAIEPLEPNEVLAKQFTDYKRWDYELQLRRTDSRSGWLFRGCDATLFEGLRSMYQGGIDLEQARLNVGEWLRRDRDLGNCYEQRDPRGNRLSASQISRDMLLGIGWWVYNMDRPDVAREIVEYADTHGDVMGPGASTRTGIGIPLKATFLKLANWDRLDSHYPVAVTGLEEGYARHLAAWHLHLRAVKTGGMETGFHWWIEEQVAEQPHNPLFHMLHARYVTGDYGPAVEALLNEAYFPRDRLPSSREVCDEWIIQRDMGDDWQPCEGHSETWSGGAWLAVARWVLAEL